MVISYTKLGRGVFPLPQHSTARHHHRARQRPHPLTGRRCFWAARSSRPSLARRRRSADRRTCSRRSRATSRRTPSLAAAQASPSSWRSTPRAPWWSNTARASRQRPRSKRGDDGAGRPDSRAISCDYAMVAELPAIGTYPPGPSTRSADAP